MDDDWGTNIYGNLHVAMFSALKGSKQPYQQKYCSYQTLADTNPQVSRLINPSKKSLKVSAKQQGLETISLAAGF